MPTYLEAGENFHQRARVDVATLASQLAQAQGLKPCVRVQLLDTDEGDNVASGIATEGGQDVSVSPCACTPSREPDPDVPLSQALSNRRYLPAIELVDVCFLEHVHN